MNGLPAVLRPVGLLEALDNAIHQVRSLQQLGQLHLGEPWQNALEQTLLDAPDPVFTQGQRQGPTSGDRVLDALEARMSSLSV